MEGGTLAPLRGKLWRHCAGNFIFRDSLLKELRLPSCPPNPVYGKYPTHCRRFLPQALRMPQQDAQNGSHEVKEPTPKIAKLHENGDVSGNVAPFFRVKKLSEKAVLPARGSPLSAGYDLSR
ncbi:hypothetical protein C1H46_045562 [Malus baccata]|uniref:Uncharacterized protein n=1 Tax=Malus baccata TaxID=106549 RepID=A0A540K3W4_MALBA|nr:hypothetical protein C1H46_045562 [Malus baccata]